MAKDKNINIKIKADSKEAESGIDKVSTALNKFSKKNNKSLASLNNLYGSLSLATKAFGLITTGIKKAVATIKDLNATALVQIKAEKQLETASKNNPFLNAQNVKQLKNFASELQKIGTVGDEQLLPLMAQLAAAGRTQAEIQDIMSAALDVSASGAMSMESAVKNLNKTFSGLSGELGESIPQIKNLTKEQLQNGEAVKVIAKQYEGMAAQTAKATGSGIQLSNAIGDLKEQLGMGFTAIIAPVQRMFTNLIVKVGNAIGKVNELLGFAKSEQDSSTLKQSDLAAKELTALKDRQEKLNDERIALEQRYNDALQKEQEKGVNSRAAATERAANENLKEHERIAKENIEYINQQIKGYESAINSANEKIKAEELKLATPGISTKEKSAAEKNIKQYKKEIKDTAREILSLNREIEQIQLEFQLDKSITEETSTTSASMKPQIDEIQRQVDEVGRQIEEKEKELNALQKAEKEAADANPNDEKAKELIKSNTEEMYKNINAIKAKAQAMKAMGKDVDDTAVQQEIVNTVEQSYIDLVTKDTSLVTTNNSAAKERLKKLEEEAQKLQTLLDLKKDPAATKELVLKWGSDSLSELEQLRNELASLELLKEQLSNGSITMDVDLSQVDKAIENLKQSLSKEQFQQVASNVSSVLGTLSAGLNNISTYFNSIMENRLSDVQEESDAEADSLKMQYEEGLISYEEYCAKKEELDKEAARKEYKIKLAQWQMDLAMATVSAAQAVANALASGTPPLNIVNAVTAGIMGAAQIATIAGNKPVAPSFSTGGFLTGTSTSGDKIPFKGNAGEAILNPAEQRNFMRLANGEGTNAPVSVNMPITIENNASNEVSVSAQNDYDRIRVTVDKIVNSGLKNGTYNESLSIAQGSMKGKTYL